MDLGQIKQKLEALNKAAEKTSGGSKGSSDTWRPSPGENTIRIVPYKFDRDNPFTELYFHYNIGAKSYLSPASFGKPDPIVEFSDELKGQQDKDSWVLGKKIEPKIRIFAPVIVRGKENDGVKYWGFGTKVWKTLMTHIMDPDCGDITDPTNGRDLIVTSLTPEQAGNKYGDTVVRIKMNSTPLTEDKETLQIIADTQKKITDVFPEPSYDELSEVLDKYMNPDKEDTDDESGASSESTLGESTVDTSTATPAAKSTDVEQDFDKLFNS